MKLTINHEFYIQCLNTLFILNNLLEITEEIVIYVVDQYICIFNEPTKKKTLYINVEKLINAIFDLTLENQNVLSCYYLISNKEQLIEDILNNSFNIKYIKQTKH